MPDEGKGYRAKVKQRKGDRTTYRTDFRIVAQRRVADFLQRVGELDVEAYVAFVRERKRRVREMRKRGVVPVSLARLTVARFLDVFQRLQ